MHINKVQKSTPLIHRQRGRCFPDMDINNEMRVSQFIILNETHNLSPAGGNGTNINKIILSLLKYFNIPKIKNGKQQIIGR